MIRRKIEFQNVFFVYQGKGNQEVLKDISITINLGETIGILGATVSGKSTMVNLKPRFYDTTAGEILIDDVDVRRYKLADWRDKVAIVLQKSEMFNTTIEENVCWGKVDAVENEICFCQLFSRSNIYIFTL